MSHFSVAILTKEEPTEETISEMLAPYDENLEVDKYLARTKEEIIKDRRDSLEYFLNNNYKKYQENPEEYKEKNKPNAERLYYIEHFMDKYNKSDDELYEEIMRDYSEDEISPDGGIYSTYNPKSQWDWWEIGGRWSGALPTKLNTNSAQLKDIDFGYKKTCKEYLREHPGLEKEYEDMITGKSPSFYKPEYLKKLYPSLNDFINKQKNFTTFAFVDLDGNWLAPGNMGWFGCSDDTHDTRISYDEKVKEIITNSPEDYYLTIVDCHI